MTTCTCTSIFVWINPFLVPHIIYPARKADATAALKIKVTLHYLCFCWWADRLCQIGQIKNQIITDPALGKIHSAWVNLPLKKNIPILKKLNEDCNKCLLSLLNIYSAPIPTYQIAGNMVKADAVVDALISWNLLFTQRTEIPTISFDL